MKRVLAIVLVGLCLTAACKKAPAAPPQKASTAPQAAPAVAAAPALPVVKPVPALLPDVVARIDGVPIERGEFERAVKSLEAQAGGPVPPDRRDTVYRQLLDQLVALRLLAAESLARKIPVPEADIAGRLAQIRGQFPTEQAFTAALAERQMTPVRLKADLKQQAQAMKLIETEIGPTVSVTDNDIQAFHQKNPEKFREPEAVHAAHILFRLPEKADDAARKKARSEADGVLAQLRKGADFAALARQHSQDPGSAANGGDLGLVPKGQTVPALEQAALALKPGQLSAIVESPFGFHIIKLIEHRAERTVPLQEVKAQVEQFLKQQQVQEKTNAFVEKLKARARIDILM